jgi:hypothetical protein
MLVVDLGNAACLRLQPVLQPFLADQVELDLEEIDVLLLRREDVLEDFARDVVPDRLAVGDRLLKRRTRSLLELEVALERLFCAFADQQLAEILQVG